MPGGPFDGCGFEARAWCARYAAASRASLSFRGGGYNLLRIVLGLLLLTAAEGMTGVRADLPLWGILRKSVGYCCLSPVACLA